MPPLPWPAQTLALMARWLRQGPAGVGLCLTSLGTPLTMHVIVGIHVQQLGIGFVH